MHSFWIDFDGRGPACVDAPDSLEARLLAHQITACVVRDCRPLPYYPAVPRLNYRVPGPAYCTRPVACVLLRDCDRQGQCDS